MEIIIHGGAGALSPELYSKEEIDEYKKALSSIVESAFDMLMQGSAAVEAVTKAVLDLEDHPLFNAGRGSVFDEQGEITMDASIMCGTSLKVGGVTELRKLKNPILAAHWVMENSPHSLITGSRLENYLQSLNFKVQNPEYFKTEKRWQQYLEAKKQGRVSLDHGQQDSNTVGAVARDKKGHLAAATSTGGMTLKFSGRVSDSSIAGAGTFADNKTCAVSGTGTGDVFIQSSLCHYIHCLMLLNNKSLKDACDIALKLLSERGGYGGVIAVDAHGNCCMPFCSGGMFRALKTDRGQMEVHVY